MSIELDMWLLLKKAEQIDQDELLQEEFEKKQFEMDYEKDIEQEELGETGKEIQEKKYFGDQFDYITKRVEEVKDYDEIYDIVWDYCSFYGSFRQGLKIDDLFLKIATDKEGRMMNERESSLDPDIYPKVYKVSPSYKWILVESAREFTNEDYFKFFPELKRFNVDLENYLDGLDIIDHYGYAVPERKQELISKIKSITPRANLQKFIDFFKSNPLASSDVGERNLGVVMRSYGPNQDDIETPVLIDAGLHSDMGFRGSKRGVR